MRKSTLVLGALALAAVVSQGALAQSGPEHRFAVRAGVGSAETSGASLVDDGTGAYQIWEADGGSSVEIGFEWYLSELIGVELLVADSEFDVELESAAGELEVGDVEAMSINLLVNFHVLRTRRVDLSVGFNLGRIDYDELEFEIPITPIGGGTPVAALPLEEDFAAGVQANVDINIGKRWGAFAGIRFQETSTTADSFISPTIPAPFEIPVDPFSLRVGGVFRFGRGS